MLRPKRHRRRALRRARQALRREGRAIYLHFLLTSQLLPLVDDLRWPWKTRGAALTRRSALLFVSFALYRTRRERPSARDEISCLRLLIALGFVVPHGRRFYLDNLDTE